MGIIIADGGITLPEKPLRNMTVRELANDGNTYEIASGSVQIYPGYNMNAVFDRNAVSEPYVADQNDTNIDLPKNAPFQVYMQESPAIYQIAMRIPVTDRYNYLLNAHIKCSPDMVPEEYRKDDSKQRIITIEESILILPNYKGNILTTGDEFGILVKPGARVIFDPTETNMLVNIVSGDIVLNCNGEIIFPYLRQIAQT